MFRQSQLVMLHSAWLNFGICDMIIHPLMKSQRWVHDHPDSSCPDPMWGCLPKDFHPIPITRPTFSRCSQFKNTQKTMWGQYTTLRSTRNTEETQRGFFFPSSFPVTRNHPWPSRRNTRSQRGNIQVMCLSMGNSYKRPLAKLGNLCQVHLNSVISYM